MTLTRLNPLSRTDVDVIAGLLFLDGIGDNLPADGGQREQSPGFS